MCGKSSKNLTTSAIARNTHGIVRHIDALKVRTTFFQFSTNFSKATEGKLLSNILKKVADSKWSTRAGDQTANHYSPVVIFPYRSRFYVLATLTLVTILRFNAHLGPKASEKNTSESTNNSISMLVRNARGPRVF